MTRRPMIRTWKITNTPPEEIRLKDATSLDAITRQLPEGWYSTFRTYDNCTRVIGLSAHIKRLPNADASLVRRNLIRLLQPFRPGEARVRVMQTLQRELYICIEPLFLLAPGVYEQGVRVVTTGLRRDDPRAKATAFISASEAEREYVAQAGVHEALMVRNGRVLEGLTSNFFYVMGDALCTARRGILLGVTRAAVIRAARGRGIRVTYRPLKVDQLPAVSEGFITSSSRGIVPVVQIDDLTVGEGRPGKTTRLLMLAYDEYVRNHAGRI